MQTAFLLFLGQIPTQAVPIYIYEIFKCLQKATPFNQ
jgi:hypothetical protein